MFGCACFPLLAPIKTINTSCYNLNKILCLQIFPRKISHTGRKIRVAYQQDFGCQSFFFSQKPKKFSFRYYCDLKISFNIKKTDFYIFDKCSTNRTILPSCSQSPLLSSFLFPLIFLYQHPFNIHYNHSFNAPLTIIFNK